MSKTLDKLSQLISQSTIPLSEQNDLLVILPIFPAKVLEDLVDIFSKHPDILVDFNENFKAKVNVLIDGRNQWEKLIDQEEEMLKKLEKEDIDLEGY